jgi:hypothetical protein
MANINRPTPPFKRSGTTITQRTSGDTLNSTGDINLVTGKKLTLGEDLEKGFSLFLGDENYKVGILNASGVGLVDIDETVGTLTEILNDVGDFSAGTWTLSGDFAIDGTDALFTYNTGDGEIKQEMADYDVSPTLFYYKVVIKVAAGMDIVGATTSLSFKDVSQSISLDVGDNVFYIYRSDSLYTTTDKLSLSITGATGGTIKITEISVSEVGSTYIEGTIVSYEDIVMMRGNLSHYYDDFVIGNYDEDKDIIFSGNDGGAQTTIMSLDVSAGQLSGMQKAVAGVMTNATAGTDYVTPTGAETLSGKSLTTIKVASFSIYDAGNSGAAKTIDWTNGSVQKVTMTDNCTFTFNNPVAGSTYKLYLIQDAGGTNTHTWTGGGLVIKWNDSTQPTWNTTGNAVNIAIFDYDGTTFRGDGWIE